MLTPLKKLKVYMEDYTRSFILVFVGAVGIGVSAVMVFHGIAQWDLIATGRVWASAESNVGFYQSLISQGYWRYAEQPFQDSILFRSTIGNGYDFFLMLIAIGWVLLLVSVVLLMLGTASYYRQKMRRLA